MQQRQFLNVVSRDEAERRFRAAVSFRRKTAQDGDVSGAAGRVLGADVVAPIDVPGFTRSNVDGFAVVARDTFSAAEETPARLVLAPERVLTGVAPRAELRPGTAMAIATGGVVPRGADAVVMVEDTDVEDRGPGAADAGALIVRRAVAPGANLAHAGSDLACGETVLREGTVLTSRDTGLLAALGLERVPLVIPPRVAVLSTGDELLAPGEAWRDGCLFDSNQRVLADAIAECGGIALERGIVRDDEDTLARKLDEALAEADLVLFSGGTSKGAGDLSYRMVGERGTILVHGVALKPGKPIVLAVVDEKPVVILPGFPTSATFTFHEFVAPWIRERAGLPPDRRRIVRARIAHPVASQRGRREYDLVHLVRARGADDLVAFPLGKGSGSLTTFARADGFHAIPEDVERLDGETEVEVTLLGPLRLPDLVVIGSNCPRLGRILSDLRREGIESKLIAAGSRAGLAALARGECDVAGIHLFDEKTDTWNKPFLPPGAELVKGYRRRQGVVTRDGRREGRLVNRNRGAGTRVLIDRLLEGARPDGYEFEVRSHQAVAAAVKSGRADWGVCIEECADGLEFEFLADEEFDVAFVARTPAVVALVARIAGGDSR